MNKKWLMAMVLNIFVLPGLGHVSMGEKKKGYLIAFLVCFLALVLVVIFEWKLMAALNSLDDPRTMFAQILPVSGEIWNNNPLIFWGGFAVMASLWIYAAIDLLRSRKKIGGMGILLVFLFVLMAMVNCSSSSSDTDESEPEEEEEPIGGADDDVTSPGLPATKLAYTDTLALDTVQGTADHYDFIGNPLDYRVLTEDLHGTEVNVAVHEMVEVSDEDAETWSENVRDCWHSAWHVFGGYRYDKYAMLVRSAESEEDDFSLSEAGVSVNATDLETDDYEFVCHELIHVWLGKLIAHQPDGTGNLFQAETWVSEGTVVYYSFRFLADVIGEAEYTDGMNERFEDYNEARGGPLDLSMAELAEEIGDDFSHEGIGVLYARGALISYLFDAELVESGFSMDDILAYLYENFGLTDTKWTQADLESAAEEITGSSFTAFFDTNLDTNTFLNVEGSFDTPLEH